MSVSQPENLELVWSYKYQERRFLERATVVNSESGSEPHGAASYSSNSTSALFHDGTDLAAVIIIVMLPVLGFASWRIWAWRRRKISAVASLDKSIWPVDLSAVLPWDRSLVEMRSNRPHQPEVVALSAAPSSGDSSLPPINLSGTRALTPSSFQVTSLPTYGDIPASMHSYRNTLIPPNTSAHTPRITPPPAYTDTLRTTSISPFAVPANPTTKLPRLVLVAATFDALLSDELKICKGDRLWLLTEYEDEWCLVQPIDRANAEKGVVPRPCLVEKPDNSSSRKSKHFHRLRLPLAIRR